MEKSVYSTSLKFSLQGIFQCHKSAPGPVNCIRPKLLGIPLTRKSHIQDMGIPIAANRTVPSERLVVSLRLSFLHRFLKLIPHFFQVHVESDFTDNFTSSMEA